MRILYVCSDPSIRAGGRGGGFTTHMEEMIHSFRKLGHEVVVLDTKGERGDSRVAGVGGESSALHGVRSHGESGVGARSSGGTTGSARGGGLGAIPRGLRVLLRDAYYVLHNASFYSRVLNALSRRPPFDFVYERYYVYQFAGTAAAARRDVPVVLEFNASIDETKLTDGLGLRALAAGIERRVTSRADAVVAVSDVVKRHLVGLKLPPEKVHVLHNGVNLEKFYPGISGEAVRQKFGFGSTDVVVGFVGGFSVWHGVHLLHEVAPLVTKKDNRLRFFMVGGREGNPRFDAFRERVEREGFAGCFRFAGEVPRDDVPKCVAAMEIAIIPWATDYGSPTKTFEYMGMAKALVAPRVAALEEVLEHGKTALLVTPGDVKGIAEALLALAADVGLRESLGKNARNMVESTFNWDRNAAATVDIARNVIEGRRRIRNAS
jgi:glycosyltransferase involved in cell wall biosynthesis